MRGAFVFGARQRKQVNMAEVETSTGLAPGPVSAVSAELELGFEQHRRELTGYCYRMSRQTFVAMR